MLRKLCFLAALTVALGMAGYASADVYTTQIANAIGTVADPAGFLVGGPNLSNVTAIGSPDSISYNNNFTSANVLSGSWQIRTVTSGTLGSFLTPASIPGLVGPANDLNYIVGVFVGQADVQITGNTAVAHFTQGQIQLFVVGAGSYIPDDPTSWGVGIDADNNGIADNAIAVFNLAGDFEVNPGAGFPITTVPAGIQNTVSLNTIDLDQSQGRLLFDDATASAGNPGDPFLPIPAPVLGPLETLVNEGILLLINQRLSSGMATLADIAELNRIAALYGLSDVGGANSAFADGIGPGAASFNQDTSALGSGDLVQGATTLNIYPVIRVTQENQEVPEPASIIVWAGLSLVGGAFGLRRKLKAKQNA